LTESLLIVFLHFHALHATIPPYEAREEVSKRPDRANPHPPSPNNHKPFLSPTKKNRQFPGGSQPVLQGFFLSTSPD